MTRSNRSHDIGFMAAPERLNVMLSRARDGLIVIGNSDTFMNARKGKEVWRKLFNHLKQNDHIYEGFPVKCEKHPDRTALLSSGEDFEMQCPDGGCTEPWQVRLRFPRYINLTCSFSDAILKCGLHKCTSSCHQLLNHSNIICRTVLTQKCNNGHNQRWHCHVGVPRVCPKCEHDKKEAAKRTQRALEEKLKRDEMIQKHLKEVAKVEEEIERINQGIKDARLDSEQKTILAQKQIDLAAAKERANGIQNLPQKEPTVISHDDHSNSRKLPVKNSSKTLPATTTSTPGEHLKLRECIKIAIEHKESPSKIEWQRQKDQENARNPAIDEIMRMIGLEDVKAQILRIKAKVETSIRQGTDVRKERLGLVLLGNPGTGIF